MLNFSHKDTSIVALIIMLMLCNEQTEHNVDITEAGISVLEAGSGYGIVLRRIAEKFPKSNFLGLELSRDAVEKGNMLAHKEGLKNIKFQEGDVGINHLIFMNI